MSASDHLQPQQFITHQELAGMHSRDWNGPMGGALAPMRDAYDTYPAKGLSQYLHPREVEAGGPEKYVAHLRDDISKNGMTDPIIVKGNHVLNGNHRALAAIDLKMDRIPIRQARSAH